MFSSSFAEYVQVGFVRSFSQSSCFVFLKVQIQNADHLIFDVDGSLLPFKLKKNLSSSGIVPLDFRDFQNINELNFLVGATVLVQKDFLVASDLLKHRLVGYKVLEQNLGFLGVVLRVDSMPMQLLIVFLYKEFEEMFPYHDDIVKSINDEKKEISVILPNGFF